MDTLGSDGYIIATTEEDEYGLNDGPLEDVHINESSDVDSGDRDLFAYG